MLTYMEKLRGLREDNDLTQTQIAEVLGTSQTMYARYERGANEMPIRHLVTLCRFYNVSADYLLETAPNPHKKQKRGACLISGAHLFAFYNYSCSQLCQTFWTSSSSSMISMSFSMSLTCSSLSSF